MMECDIMCDFEGKPAYKYRYLMSKQRLSSEIDWQVGFQTFPTKKLEKYTSMTWSLGMKVFGIRRLISRALQMNDVDEIINRMRELKDRKHEIDVNTYKLTMSEYQRLLENAL